MITTVTFRGRDAYPQNLHLGTIGETGVEMVFFDTPVEGAKHLFVTYSDGQHDVIDIDITNDGLWRIDQNVTRHKGKATLYVQVTDAETVLWRSKEFIAIIDEVGVIDDEIQQEFPTAFQQALVTVHVDKLAAAQSAKEAAESAAIVLEAKAGIDVSAASAEDAATRAGQSAASAELAASSAAGSEANAKSYAESLAGSVQQAQAHAAAAAESNRQAGSSATSALGSRLAAETAETNASQHASDAQAALTEAQGVLSQAKQEIEDKTDEQLARIPEVTAMAGEVDGIKNEIDYLHPLAFTASSVTPSLAEKGSTVTTEKITFAVNRLGATVTLDGDVISGNETTRNDTLTADRTYVIKAVLNTMSKSASLTVRFVAPVYYGVSSTYTLANSTLLNLTRELTTTKARTIRVNASAGQYILYALPVSLGTPVFVINGFEGAFEKVGDFDFTNSSGHTERYALYRSTHANLGSTTVVIS